MKGLAAKQRKQLARRQRNEIGSSTRALGQGLLRLASSRGLPWRLAETNYIFAYLKVCFAHCDAAKSTKRNTVNNTLENKVCGVSVCIRIGLLADTAPPH
eukprot:gnl/MRDRNA2_/MRDRNA2_350161_c0_seq1.p1 gnl/MRDRNA2_/MRDRNA2_350161_c0~~gnl/MRDRNA2_/MRDRNA2_350161_c0_seq1.p1  ORF type:complete len:100 (-),score=8.47 gnl/MRDRNA2_/MRDRNA2_350161_c0_seq1:11-310(-)